MPDENELALKTGAGGKAWLLRVVGVFAVIILYICFGPSNDPSVFTGFKGSLIAGAIGSIAFLILGYYLNVEVNILQRETHGLSEKTNELTEKTHPITVDTKEIAARSVELGRQIHEMAGVIRSISEQTRKLQEEREQQREADRLERLRIAEFEHFVRDETYHDVCFPDLRTDRNLSGLVYTISPVRDEHGQPKRRKSEMNSFYLITLDRPAREKVLSPEQLQDYSDAPLHTGESYFCDFYNGSWHMGQDSVGLEWHRFYMAGKIGPAEYSESANSFVKMAGPPKDVVWQADLLVNTGGTLITSEGGGWQVHLYKDQSDVFWVQPSRNAPAKRISFEEHWQTKVETTHVENFEGYFVGSAREPFLDLIERTITSAGHTITRCKKFDF